MREQYEQARRFIYQNARPLDLARWQYHFEGGSRENVLHALSYYQNPDGGFGSGLEADAWNPASSPIQTWAATKILREIDFEDAVHPIVQGILRYLDSGDGFSSEHNQWLNCVPSNNDYPHAVWWEYKDGADEFAYNPSASLAGFLIRFADPKSSLYEKGAVIARQAFEYFIGHVPFEEQHITVCFIQLFEDCEKAGADLLDMALFRDKLREQVHKNICQDTEKWGRDYVAMPSAFISGPVSLFYEDNRELADDECAFLQSSQQTDGAYAVTWRWWTDYKEFEIAANWWKSSFIIANMRYLKACGKLHMDESV